MADKTIKEVIKHLLKKGDIIRISSGEYDEYDVISICKVLKDCDIILLQDRMRMELGKDYNSYANKHESMYEWLIKNGILKEIKEIRKEWNLDDSYINNWN